MVWQNSVIKKRKENQRYDDETLVVQPMNDWLMKEKVTLGWRKP